MFLLREPSPAEAEAFILAQSPRPFSYPEVGASRTGAPAGYDVDHNRALLGRGADVFERAVAALGAWRMFRLGWCRVHPSSAPVEVGTTVAVAVRHYGFWSLNAARVVYLNDEDGARRRVGFAYGTLPAHGESGEERFSVEWDRRDGTVWYDLYAFSRPRHPLAKAGYPLCRTLQRRFARDSKAAMVRAVGGAGAGAGPH